MNKANKDWKLEMQSEPKDGDGLDAATCSALNLAIFFHKTYERLAPSFGYETREDTKSFDSESKNGKLMIAVCGEVLLSQKGKANHPSPE